MLLIKENQWGNYKHWLQELVDEFGSVYHFMYPNILTLDDTSFNDAHHPTEATCNLILNAINNRQKVLHLTMIIIFYSINVISMNNCQR